MKGYCISPKLFDRLHLNGIATIYDACQYTENDYVNHLTGFRSKDLDQIKVMVALFNKSLKSPEKCSEPIVLSQGDFDSLLEYSSSLPSGTYVGKRWKAKYAEPEWIMGEYYETGSQYRIGINWRPIIVLNAATVLYGILKQIPWLWSEA